MRVNKYVHGAEMCSTPFFGARCRHWKETADKRTFGLGLLAQHPSQPHPQGTEKHACTHSHTHAHPHPHPHPHPRAHPHAERAEHHRQRHSKQWLTQGSEESRALAALLGTSLAVTLPISVKLLYCCTSTIWLSTSLNRGDSAAWYLLPLPNLPPVTPVAPDTRTGRAQASHVWARVHARVCCCTGVLVLVCACVFPYSYVCLHMRVLVRMRAHMYAYERAPAPTCTCMCARVCMLVHVFRACSLVYMHVLLPSNAHGQTLCEHHNSQAHC